MPRGWRGPVTPPASGRMRSPLRLRLEQAVVDGGGGLLEHAERVARLLAAATLVRRPEQRLEVGAELPAVADDRAMRPQALPLERGEARRQRARPLDRGDERERVARRPSALPSPCAAAPRSRRRRSARPGPRRAVGPRDRRSAGRRRAARARPPRRTAVRGWPARGRPSRPVQAAARATAGFRPRARGRHRPSAGAEARRRRRGDTRRRCTASGRPRGCRPGPEPDSPPPARPVRCTSSSGRSEARAARSKGPARPSGTATRCSAPYTGSTSGSTRRLTVDRIPSAPTSRSASIRSPPARIAVTEPLSCSICSIAVPAR